WVTGGGWVATGWPQLREWWCGGHRVLMPRRGRDREFIRCATVGPAPIFFALVASSAQSSSVIPAGGTALGPGPAVVGFFHRIITERGRTRIIAQFQHLGEPGGESPPPRLHGHQMPIRRSGIHPAATSFQQWLGQTDYHHHVWQHTMARD